MRFEGRGLVPPRLDLTPLIDVVLNLLVFFLLTIGVAESRFLRLDLPESTTADAVKNAVVVVQVSAEGDVRVLGQPCGLAALGDCVRPHLSSPGAVSVRLETDKRAPVQLLVDVMGALREAGAAEIELGTTGRPSTSSQ